MLTTCDYPGCETLTIGTLCVVHEPPVEARRFPRGRPYPRLDLAITGGRLDSFVPAAVEELTPTRAVSLRGGT